MTEPKKEISKAEAKYLRRTAKQSGRSKELTARTLNRKAAQKVQQEEIAKRHAEIDKTGPSPLIAELRTRMIDAKKPPLNLNQQVALMAGTLAAQQEAEHVHGPECNHKPMFEAVEPGSNVALDTETTLTPGIVNEAMEKSQT